MAVISLSGMRFYAYHGCFDEERAIGTHFCVDLSVSVNSSKAQKSDDLSDTVNYADVFQVVKHEMEIPSHLLEHLADRIASAVLSKFPQVSAVSLKVSKMAPPLGGAIDAVSVSLDMLKEC